MSRRHQGAAAAAKHMPRGPAAETASPAAKGAASPLRRVVAYVAKYPGLFSLTLGLALASTAFGLLVPMVIKWVLQGVEEGQAAGVIAWGVPALVACFFLRDALNSARIRVNNGLEQKVLVDLRVALHRKLLDLPVGFFDKRQSGEVASRVVDDVTEVERALIDGTEQGLVALLTFLGIVAILFSLQPALALCVLAPVPILVWLGFYHAGAQRKNWKAVREASSALNALLIEDIQANRLITAFGLKERESARFTERALALRTASLRAMYRWSLYGPGTGFITSLGTVGLVGLGAWLIQTDPAFGFPQFIAFYAYAAMLFQPIGQLNQLNNMMATARAAGERVFEIMDHPVEIEDVAQPQPFPSGPLTIRYSGVCFAYPGRPQVIKPLELTLPCGQITALVGHTGAGKSTLAALLLRYYDCTHGAVQINGIDVRQLALGDLRGHIGYVSQDPFLFDGTVEDNLRIASPQASPEQLWGALRAARAAEFVERLPEGLKTLIGERGIRLSMGEKQRLTIARMLLRNPPIIVLDEATASVDTLTERAIQEALDELVRGRTVLVIAHRLSTVRRAHQIVVLDHGELRERGTHDELLRQGGLYARLWSIQADLIDERE